MKHLALVVLALLLPGFSDAGEAPVPALPPGTIGHVFIIVLENHGYEKVFGAETDGRSPYLGRELPRRGALLSQYHAIGHSSLPNYIAMVSGQSPNPETQRDCPRFLDWSGTMTPDADGQVTGAGCVYPGAIRTIANQMEEGGRSWKAYMEDMGIDPKRDGGLRCAHPTLGAADRTRDGSLTDQYVTRHNPFMYHHAIIDDAAKCREHVVPLTDLTVDLQAKVTTPHYAFIAPNLCNDAHEKECADGGPGGLAASDRFLERWVPRIMASAAFRENGLLIITFDEATRLDTGACCNEPTGPNTQKPGKRGPGGGRVGAVLISRFIRPGTVSNVPYNHYSMLKSVEQLFGLPYLGYAGQAGLAAFGTDVFTDPSGGVR